MSNALIFCAQGCAADYVVCYLVSLLRVIERELRPYAVAELIFRPSSVFLSYSPSKSLVAILVISWF